MRAPAAIAAAGCALFVAVGCGAAKHAAATTSGTGPATTPPSTAAQQPACPSDQTVGIDAAFGHRRTTAAAEALRAKAEAVGFQGLVVQRRGCNDYAVVLLGLRNVREGKALRREAAAAGLAVALECRSHPVEPGIAAVFGHRRKRSDAVALRARAETQGFKGLMVVQDSCNDWEVDLYGLKTRVERNAFRAEARRAGFHVTFEPG